MDIHKLAYEGLIEAAAHPGEVTTLVFAGVIALAPQRAAPYDVAIAGLDGEAMEALRQGYFPNLPLAVGTGVPWRATARCEDEFDDLVELLLDHRSFRDQESLWLAHAVATACMGRNHLWRDLGLPNRAALSWLMQHHFSGLAASNTGDMKWKKFLYRQLCVRAELFVCKSPNCRACDDYVQCFGAED